MLPELMADRYELGALTLAVSTETEGIVVQWLGRSDARNPDEIVSPYLNSAMIRALSLRVPLVHDFAQLQFFNSSTIATLLRHFREVGERRVTLHVRYAAAQRWQRAFFAGLETTRESLARIRVQSVPPRA
jgi:hypothetical protein